jgi:Protein of unknown function (DUF2911)/Protein of unknown function (DUF3347)
MKNLLIISILCFLNCIAQAQEPAKSPEAAFTQQFGSSEIQVAYARPLARGRKIFGGLVPFDSIWRTGANDCTTLSFKEVVIIGNKIMPAGKYALFTIPNKDEWTIILNSDTILHGTNGYNMTKDLHRFKVKSVKSDRFYETFTIEINDFTPQGAAFLNLMWENTMVQILLKSPLFEQLVVESKPVVTPAPEPKVAQTTPVAPVETPVVDLKTQFSPVLTAYYGLKDALVADNSKLAAEKGKILKKALQDLDTQNWTAQQRNVFDSKAKKMESDAQHIGDNAHKIDHQRDHLENLSKNLFEIAKSLKINTEPVYWQFCPMANDNKGAYWLSKDNKVKNPYFGKSMLTCGSIKETLK